MNKIVIHVATWMNFITIMLSESTSYNYILHNPIQVKCPE